MKLSVRKLAALALGVAMVASFASCEKEQEEKKPNPKPKPSPVVEKDIELSKKEVSVEAGKTTEVMVNFANGKVEVSSKAEAIAKAKVSQDYKKITIEGVKKGETTIEVKDAKGKMATITVKVSDAATTPQTNTIKVVVEDENGKPVQKVGDTYPVKEAKKKAISVHVTGLSYKTADEVKKNLVFTVGTDNTNKAESICTVTACTDPREGYDIDIDATTAKDNEVAHLTIKDGKNTETVDFKKVAAPATVTLTAEVKVAGQTKKPLGGVYTIKKDDMLTVEVSNLPASLTKDALVKGITFTYGSGTAQADHKDKVSVGEISDSKSVITITTDELVKDEQGELKVNVEGAEELKISFMVVEAVKKTVEQLERELEQAKVAAQAAAQKLTEAEKTILQLNEDAAQAQARVTFSEGEVNKSQKNVDDAKTALQTATEEAKLDEELEKVKTAIDAVADKGLKTTLQNVKLTLNLAVEAVKNGNTTAVFEKLATANENLGKAKKNAPSSATKEQTAAIEALEKAIEKIEAIIPKMMKVDQEMKVLDAKKKALEQSKAQLEEAKAKKEAGLQAVEEAKKAKAAAQKALDAAQKALDAAKKAGE